MATTTTSSGHKAAETLTAFEDKIKAQITDAKARLQQFEATAKQKGVQAETAALIHVKAVKENIERKLHDLKATHESQIAKAKSDIEAEVAMFKVSVAELGARFTTSKK
jgi:predicted metal-dependent TIM-barrel fold hydrolase